MSKILLPYGLKDGALIHISKVESGLVCNCICPSCHTQLVAKKGENVQDHFAHYSTESCAGALESALHIATKEILTKEKRITLPAVYIQFKSGRQPMLLAAPKEYKVDSVRVESPIGNITPDLILSIGQRELLVEIFVTHRVDRQKINKITELGMSAIEVDLSTSPRDLSMETLSELIVNGVDNKRWLNNERVRQEHQKLMDQTVRKEIIRFDNFQKWNGKIEKCPKKMRKWNGRYPRNAYINDCLWCEYCLDIEPNTKNIDKFTHIYCIGHILDPFSDLIIDK